MRRFLNSTQSRQLRNVVDRGRLIGLRATNFDIS